MLEQIKDNSIPKTRKTFLIDWESEILSMLTDESRRTGIPKSTILKRAFLASIGKEIITVKTKIIDKNEMDEFYEWKQNKGV